MRYFLFLLIACAACTEPVEQAPISQPFEGVYADGIFAHSRLGFTLQIPDSWRVIPQEEIAGRESVSLESLRQKVSDLDQRARAFEPFLALEPYASEDSSYVTLLLMAEDLTLLPQVNNAYDYFNQQAAQVQGSAPSAYPRYEFSDISQQAIGGRQAFSRGTMIHSSEEEMNPMLSLAVPCGSDLLVVQMANFDSAEELNMARGLLDQIQWKAQ